MRKRSNRRLRRSERVEMRRKKKRTRIKRRKKRVKDDGIRAKEGRLG